SSTSSKYWREPSSARECRMLHGRRFQYSATVSIVGIVSISTRCALARCHKADSSLQVNRAGAAGSTSVRTVDVDIAVRQVAGPHGGLAAAQSDVDGDLDLTPLHVRGDRRLVVARHDATVPGHPHAANAD